MFSGFTAAHRGGTGSPLMCLRGFMDTWRTWELVLPMLVREHDVLAPTLPGHAGGPPIDGSVSTDVFVDAVERLMDVAGLGLAHIVGNSLATGATGPGESGGAARSGVGCHAARSAPCDAADHHQPRAHSCRPARASDARNR